MTQIAERIEELEESFGVEIEVTGGGKGWTAKATQDGNDIDIAKATSKAEAIEALANGLAAWDLNGNQTLAELEGEAEGEESECSAECQSSQSNICQCKCDGANHGIALGAARLYTPVMLGDKPCRCGCGQITKREFVAGHDARFATMQAAKAKGMTVEEYRASLKVERNKRAASKRRDKRAAAKAAAPVVEAKVAAVVAALKPAPKPSRQRQVAEVKHTDDLPF